MNDTYYVDLYHLGIHKPEHLAPAKEHIAFCGIPLPPECYKPIDFRPPIRRKDTENFHLCPACQEWLHTYQALQNLTHGSLPGIHLHQYYYPIRP